MSAAFQHLPGRKGDAGTSVDEGPVQRRQRQQDLGMSICAEEVLSRPVDQDLLGDHDLGVLVGGSFDEFAVAERGAGPDERDEVG